MMLEREISDSRFKHLTRAVNHCKLAARPVTGVNPEHGVPFHGRNEQQIFKINAEKPDCRRLCTFRQLRADFVFD